ncbi:CopG family transcriptional regulator [Mesorhizobium caraganae]|uniref:ribbon-helix-helix domain-containing protein n=1 Tax=Mesorhizobium caraganae TaxID=483206 RepID=UPI0019395ECE|nr:ribbon-helix-helix domain-containing protein [Mesorhizobium caraganae]MBM2716163.1 CopG family transcriptional regulator [Mesorhizobium caraganae]
MGRPRTDKHPARLTVTLEEEDYKEVCARAKRNDVSAAWVIRRAVQDYLGRSSSPMSAPRRPAGRMESRK